MSKRRSLTHVRQFIEDSIQFANHVSESKDTCPALRDYAVQMRLVGNAILRKHSAKNEAQGQRKDLHVERRP